MRAASTTSQDSDGIALNVGIYTGAPLSATASISDEAVVSEDPKFGCGKARQPKRSIDRLNLVVEQDFTLDTPSDESYSTNDPRDHRSLGRSASDDIDGRQFTDPNRRKTRETTDILKGPKILHPSPRRRLRQHGGRSGCQKFEYVSVPPLLVPKSNYGGAKDDAPPVCDERSALSEVLHDVVATEDEPPDFNEILLDHFVIYRPAKQTHYPWQMVTLDNMMSSREGCKYLLNGVLRRGKTSTYVEAAEIDIDKISIDGLEDPTVHTVQHEVYLQTVFCAKRRHRARPCWYRLLRPSAEYRSLHQKFLWVADLAKHVIDYLKWRDRTGSESHGARLRDFRSDFLDTLMNYHGEDGDFLHWLGWYGHTDFRIAMNRHREFLFNRAFNLDDVYLTHQLWSDMMVRPGVSVSWKDQEPEDTIVTPYVFQCCKQMPWSYTLQPEGRSTSVEIGHRRRATRMGFSDTSRSKLLSDMTTSIPEAAMLLERAARTQPTAVVDPQDALDKFAIIRMKQSKAGSIGYDFSYVYVQGVEPRRNKVELSVIFMYLPSETICLDGYYPYGNELFLSDSCNCSAENEPILLTDVVRLVEVAVGEGVNMQQKLFTRQKYLHDEDAILRTSASDMRCPCRRSSEARAIPEKPNGLQKKSLPGLGLFAGCGNFDFGLEESGAIDFVAAIETNEAALKTYAANRSRGSHGLVLDSVNPCLSKILKGGSDLPPIGSVSCISSGSPCKGFSLINTRRGDDKGMRNCSLVASALSYVETYLPAYAILENVSAMGSGVGNSCNQAIACLVGLGYQVRRLTLDSRAFNSPQRRKRLFLIAASPNVPLPHKPEPIRTADLGFAKASQVSTGLPSVDNDDQICIPFPDHVPGARQTPMFREMVRQIPRFPKSMNLVESVRAGRQGPVQLEWFWSRKSLYNVKNHTAFTRIDPDGPVPTIVATPSPACGFGGGRIIHWDEHRTLTLLEARRAQGFRDEDVIIGDMPQQWSQVGNAVNRPVAVALGKVIADSWNSSDASVEKEVINSPVPQKCREAVSGSVPGLGIDDDRHTCGSLPSKLLADETKAETTNLCEDSVDSLESEATVGNSDKDSDNGKDVDDSLPIGEYVEDPESDLLSLQGTDCLGRSKLSRDEIELLKDLLRPRHHTSSNPQSSTGKQDQSSAASDQQEFDTDLRFSQIQRRETTSVLQRDSTGERKRVRMVAERNIEFRTKPESSSLPPSLSSSSSSSSQQNISHGTLEQPIEVESWVSISKRRKRGDERGPDEEDEDGDLQSWVGRRVRSKFVDE